MSNQLSSHLPYDFICILSILEEYHSLYELQRKRLEDRIGTYVYTYVYMYIHLYIDICIHVIDAVLTYFI